MSIKVPVYRVKLVRERMVTFPSGIVEDPKATAAFFHRLIGSADREHLAALFVSMGRPTGATIIAVGTIAKVSTHMRETFKAAVLASAESIILAHNHPSGLVVPSRSDIRLTRCLITAGTIVGIPITDHFIVSPSSDFSSMKANALLWGTREAA
jgi:DNA repair protein RadC